MTGKLKALFEFELHGVGLPRPADFKISGGSAHLEIGNPAKLSVDIDGIDEVTAQAEASRVARKLYERLLLRLSINVDYSVRPRLVSSHFSPAASLTPNSTVMASIPANAVLVAAATAIISDVALGALVHDVEVTIVAPPKPPSLLDTAIEMYFVGLESPNRVVRFLVLYSALVLVSHDGSQEGADRLLRAQNTKLNVLPSPRKAKKTETLYTKLRNELIHADESRRGRDPARAMRAIEENIHDFQRDVALVLSQL